MSLHHQKYPIEPYGDVNISVMLIRDCGRSVTRLTPPKNE